MKRKSPEKAIENEILGYLFHEPLVRAWKYDNIGIWDRKANAFRSRQNIFKPKGFPDIFGYVLGRDNGKLLHIPLFIEVKSLSGRLSPEQVEFLDIRRSEGCIAFMARSLENVIEHPDLKPFLKANLF